MWIVAQIIQYGEILMRNLIDQFELLFEPLLKSRRNRRVKVSKRLNLINLNPFLENQLKILRMSHL